LLALKPLVWLGSSKKDLMGLPTKVIDEFGFGLYLAQVGRRHESSKILHVFQKKSKYGSATPRRDRALIATRLKRAAEIAEETAHDTPKNN